MNCDKRERDTEPEQDADMAGIEHLPADCSDMLTPEVCARLDKCFRTDAGKAGECCIVRVSRGYAVDTGESCATPERVAVQDDGNMS